VATHAQSTRKKPSVIAACSRVLDLHVRPDAQELLLQLEIAQADGSIDSLISVS
jgi:hypothetical protein